MITIANNLIQLCLLELAINYVRTFFESYASDMCSLHALVEISHDTVCG